MVVDLVGLVGVLVGWFGVLVELLGGDVSFWFGIFVFVGVGVVLWRVVKLFF